MLDSFSQFHFIRPMWLLSLIPVIIIIAGLILKNARKDQWTSVIDQHLLKHLLVSQKKIAQSSLLPILVLSLALLLSVLALAGPTWQKRPLPVFETELSRVIILDLSLSMAATDIKPSRLIRAKHKIKDILGKTNEGQVALIVYAGDAFVISPLTTDANTIMTLIPPLDPSLMPVLGSQPQQAFRLADELLNNAGVLSGQIIWITDGIDDNDYGQVAENLKSSRHQLSILAVGTRDGAPIPMPDGQGFLKDPNGSIVLPSLKLAPLEEIARLNNGSVTRLSADDKDIEHLLASLKKPEDFISSEDDLEMDTWIEFGPWLLVPVVLVTALAFRKGVVVILFLTIMPLYPASSSAAEQTTNNPAPEKQEASLLERSWKNLWQTQDQQAAKAFMDNDHARAAELFQQKEWKSAAMYRSGQYNLATDLLTDNPSATADYNRGNALAKSGQLEASIAAYESALQKAPDMEDAQFNKSLVEEMLKQQQEQQQQDNQQQNDQQQDGDQQDEQQQQGQQQEDDQQQQSEQQQENQQQQQSEQQPEEQEGEPEASELEQMSEAEREQVLEQWLRMIKDDPGGLLRRKMYMEYQRRQEQGKKLQDKGEQVW